MSKFTSGKVQFLDEVKGPLVQELKQQFSDLLRCEHQIRRAFLVRIKPENWFPGDVPNWQEDGSPGPRLALCLAGERTNDLQLARTANAILSQLFPGVKMYVLYLNDSQLREVSQLAEPFYVSDGSDQCRPN